MAALLAVQAQLIQESETPPPVTGVLDTADYLRDQPEVFGHIVARIQKLKQERNFELFLVIEPLLIGMSVPERAHELRRHWVPDGNGVVVVFESSSGQLAIGFDILNLQQPEQRPVRAIPSYQASAILNRALATPDSKAAPEVYLDVLMEGLAREFETYFSNLTLEPPPERTLKTTLVVVGTLASLGLVALAIGAFVKFFNLSSSRRFRLPEVEIDERLAAPCGASVTTHRFATPEING